MTRSELIESLASRFPQLVKADADMAVDQILGAIRQTLVQGHRVEIRGFGSFSLNYRAPRIGRNPKTGEKGVSAGEVRSPFKASKEMRERLKVESRE